MTENNESAANRAIREALESVERLEREAKGPLKNNDTDDNAEGVDVLPADGAAPTAESSLPPPPPGSATGAAPPAAKKSVTDALLEATIKAKAEMADALAQMQKEAKDMFDRLARVQADYENFRKRVTREKQDAIKFANEGVFKEMIPILDNLQRALQAAGAEQSNLLEGVRLVAKQFEDTLAKLDVQSFTSQGEPFDPARHEAVGTRADENVPSQHVCEEYQRGYVLHDRLLRPALVIVSSGPPN